MQVYNFFVCGPKFTVFLPPNVRGVVVDQVFFPIFDMWICSGDIRDQTRKLSEIAPNFRRFLPSQILGGGPSPKVVPTWTFLPRCTSRGKVSWRYTRNMVCRRIQFGWVNMQVYNFFGSGPKFTTFLSPNVGGVVVDQVFFAIFDMWICSGYIRDQTRKLSQIALNFRRFLPSQILGAVLTQK